MGYLPSCKNIIKREIKKGKFRTLSRRHIVFKLLVPGFVLWGFSPVISTNYRGSATSPLLKNELLKQHLQTELLVLSINETDDSKAQGTPPKTPAHPQLCPFCSLLDPSGSPSPVKIHSDQCCSFHIDKDCTDLTSHPQHHNHKIVSFMCTYSPGVKAS